MMCDDRHLNSTFNNTNNNNNNNNNENNHLKWKYLNKFPSFFRLENDIFVCLFTF